MKASLLPENSRQSSGRFDASNLRDMQLVNFGFPICDALRHELSWTHDRLLCHVANPDARQFHHRLLLCFVLIDLKTGRTTQEDIRQMLLYAGSYEAEETCPGEHPPIGILLGTGKNEAAVRYTFGERAKQVFAVRYRLYLPTEEELHREFEAELAALPGSGEQHDK